MVGQPASSDNSAQKQRRHTIATLDQNAAIITADSNLITVAGEQLAFDRRLARSLRASVSGSCLASIYAGQSSLLRY